MKEQIAQNPNHSGEEAYNFHMMFLTNTESEDLRILPTHRVVKDLPNFSEEWLLEQLQEDFIFLRALSITGFHMGLEIWMP